MIKGGDGYRVEYTEETIEAAALRLQELLDTSKSTVFFGGAGVSTESGIPDFRSVDGLYNQKYSVPPEEILSHTYFFRHTEEFYRFYRDKLLPKGVLPNPAHIKLAELEAAGKLRCIVTQNIDTLHRDAGSKNVYELHGTVSSYHCVNCRKGAGTECLQTGENVPRCPDCGGIMKPDVVLYGEQLDSDICRKSISAIAEADVLIVAGTSLTVYPAAGFIKYYTGTKSVLINRDPTPLDSTACMVCHMSVGKLFERIKV